LFGLNNPDLPDRFYRFFIGCKAFQYLESLYALIGYQKGLQVGFDLLM
jgi:hypothetical protein